MTASTAPTHTATHATALRETTTPRPRAYYLTFDQATTLYEAYCDYARTLTPGMDAHKRFFEVRLDEDNYIRLYLDATADVVGEVPNTPACDFTVTGPYSRGDVVTPGPRGRTWVDRFGMAVLYEITTVADKIAAGLAGDARRQAGETISAAAARKADAAVKLTNTLDTFTAQHKLRTPVLDLVAQRSLQVAR